MSENVVNQYLMGNEEGQEASGGRIVPVRSHQQGEYCAKYIQELCC